MVSSDGWTSWGGAVIDFIHYRGWKHADNDFVIILLPAAWSSEECFLYLYKIENGELPSSSKNSMDDIVVKFDNAESNLSDIEQSAKALLEYWNGLQGGWYYNDFGLRKQSAEGNRLTVKLLEALKTLAVKKFYER